MDTKLFLFELGLNLIYLYQIYTMKPSEFEIFLLVENNNKKTSENYRNCCVAEKRIDFKL